MTRANCSFVFSQIVFDRRDPLLLRTELHLGAQHLDAGDDAALLETRRLVEDGLRRLQLRLRRLHASRGGERLEVEIGRHEHDQVARALDVQLRGRQVVAFRLATR